jgi:hypothetical protein
MPLLLIKRIILRTLNCKVIQLRLKILELILRPNI